MAIVSAMKQANDKAAVSHNMEERVFADGGIPRGLNFTMEKESRTRPSIR
jgi:hypothetical protein